MIKLILLISFLFGFQNQILLFNGKNLDGWKIYGTEKWYVSDGELICESGPEEEYENVLKPFYRIDKSRGQNKSGVGLGLSIANDIIHSHGGNISLAKSPLNGLRVKISLPL